MSAASFAVASYSRPFFGARHKKHAGFLHALAGAGFRAHHLHRLRCRTDKPHADFAACTGEVCVLGEEAVAGMNGFGAAALGYIEDLFEIQIGLTRGGRTDVIGVVGLAHVQRAAVNIREDRHRLDTNLAAGAHDAHCDFAAIGNEDSLEHESDLDAGDPVGGAAYNWNCNGCEEFFTTAALATQRN